MNGAIVEAEGLTRRYGTVLALDRIDLAIGAGERVALIGHNGAGKTTLIKLVLGLLPPSHGRLTVLGGKPGHPVARRVCAYMPENLAFHRALTGREQLLYLARLKGVSINPEKVLERVGLDHAMDRRIATYSKGMRQRLGLAQLLLGKPRLVILDEPTTGLDPVSRHDFYEIVSELAAGGAAIIQSSHVLTELEARTDRILILRDGRVAVSGDLPQLRRQAALPVRIKVHAHPGKNERLQAQLGGKPLNGSAVEIHATPSQKMDRLRAIGACAEDIDDVDIIQPSLEDLYRYYSGEADTGDRS